MRIKLAYKLFGALVLILLLVVAALVLSRVLFARNFRNYIQQADIERLTHLVPLLQEEYKKTGSWANIEKDTQFVLRQLRHTVGMRGPHQPRGPRHRRPGGHHRPRPPAERPRMLLSDAQLRPIVGTPQPGDEPQLVAIAVDGQTVGWLGLANIEPFKKGPPALFVNQQLRLVYLFGGVLLLLTALVAVLLTRHLLRPIQLLTDGTRALAKRDFSTRIQRTGHDEFGELAQHFNAMAETLQQYEGMRRQWLSDISHELRTPIAVLRGEIESLQDGIRQPSEENLQSLHNEILHIAKLVEDLHTISMADANALHLHKGDVAPADLLESAADAFRPRLNARSIQLHLAQREIANTRLHVDPDRIAQVFINILENACRYVAAPGTVTIAARAEDRHVAFSFSDTGPGVPEASLDRLFDRLYRVDAARDKSSGGSGLGLAICKHIVAAHGGRIRAEHNDVGGLTITVRLPILTSAIV